MANDKLYVADTNNHAIRVVDLKTNAVATLQIKNLEPPVIAAANEAMGSEVGPNAEAVSWEAQEVRAGSQGALVIQVELPPGYHLNPMAPQRYRVSIEKGDRQLGLFSKTTTGVIGRDSGVQLTSKSLKLPLRLRFNAHEPGAAELKAQLTLFYCREDNTGECRIKTLVWNVPIRVVQDPSAPTEIKIQGKVSAE